LLGDTPRDKGLGQSRFGKIRQVIFLVRQSLCKSMGELPGESLLMGEILGKLVSGWRQSVCKSLGELLRELLGELLLLGEILVK
jgi:hypothetical protein